MRRGGGDGVLGINILILRKITPGNILGKSNVTFVSRQLTDYDL